MQCPSCGLQIEQPNTERCPRCGYQLAYSPSSGQPHIDQAWTMVHVRLYPISGQFTLPKFFASCLTLTFDRPTKRTFGSCGKLAMPCVMKCL